MMIKCKYKKNKSRSSYSKKFGVELEFRVWTSIPLFVILIFELQPKAASITRMMPIIKVIKALPKYLVAIS